MKRDMDLVRSILMRVESADSALEIESFFEDSRPANVTLYHLMLMQQRGLVDARFERDMNGTVYGGSVFGLTWDGQDFLDSMRDDRVWAKAKKAISSSVGSTTFEVTRVT